MRLARPTGPSLLPAAAIESPRRSRTTAHHRARTRFRRDVGRAFGHDAAMWAPWSRRRKTAETGWKPGTCEARAGGRRDTRQKPIHYASDAWLVRNEPARAHRRTRADAPPSSSADAHRPRLSGHARRWLIGGESATARRPAALALGTEAARVQREAHARHRVTASPHADGHRRRRPREAPITSARPPRPKPAGARRGRPGSRADQGNAFVPSNAATANPETFVSWSGEPG